MKMKKGKKFWSALFFTLTSIIVFLIIVLPISFRPTPSLMEVGDVAMQDIHAPRSFSYISEYLTTNAKDEAEKSVLPIYLPPDPTISREQIEKLQTSLEFISSIRNDDYASKDQKTADLTAIESLEINPETAEAILNLSDERWDAVQNESLYVLEMVLRNTIRDDQVPAVRRDLTTKIDFSFSNAESSLISTIVSQLVTANSIFSIERTNEQIASARDAVEPVSQSFIAGEIIVNNGEVIDKLGWEALQELGYTEPQNRTLDYVSAGLIVITVMALVAFYLRRVRQSKGFAIEGLPAIIFIFLLFLITARLIIPNHTVLPYIFPIAAFGLLVASVFDYETGLIGALVLSVLSAYNQSNSVDLALYYFIPTAAAIFVLGRGRRINIFFLAGLVQALSGSMLVIAYRILNSFIDISGAGALIGAAFANGVISVSLALILQYLLSQLLGKTTAMQLMDLSRPDHPLLQELLTSAPGTYQHSLQLANLAEQAAREINGDALLTRVGALYHDVGKTKNPGFFVENQTIGKIDTHDSMDPVLAAATIIRHVPDGVKLAKKHRIPPQIQDFILEHHGTMITRYQYSQAVHDAGSEEKVEKSLFQYPGPIPHRKETAILMFADGCEARMRAEEPESIDDIVRIVRESVNAYIDANQLDNADLTLRDIQTVIHSFTRTFKNAYHHRIKYPSQEIEED